MKTVRIGRWQLFLLTANFTIGTTVFVLLGTLIEAGRQDAWLIPLWGGAFGCALAAFWSSLLNRYPGHNIVGVCRIVLGPKIGSAVALMYVWYCVNVASWVTRNLSDFLKMTIMPHTPMHVIHVMFLLVAGYAVVKGIEPIARLMEIFAPIMFLSFWFVLFVAVSPWEWHHFRPVFGTDLRATFLKTVSFLGFPFMQAMVVTFVWPFAGRKAMLPFVGGIAAAAVSLSAIIAFLLGIMGIYRSSHLTFPLFTLAQEVEVGSVLQHLESIMSMIWLLLIFSQLSVSLFGAFEGLREIFRLRTRKPIVAALILIISALAVTIEENIQTNLEWNQKYTFPYFSFLMIVVPLVLYAVGWIKRRTRGKTA